MSDMAYGPLVDFLVSRKIGLYLDLNIYELFLVNILRCDQCSNSWKLEEGALVNCSSKENLDWQTELEEVPHGQWTQILVELQRGLHMSQANNFWDKMLPWQFNCQCILQTLRNDEI